MSALWAALLPSPPDCGPSPEPANFAVWALQFTPKVSVCDKAVLLELEGSARLFGGARALRERIESEARGELGVGAIGWAPTSLAALACARCGVADGFAKPLTVILDALPLTCLTAVGAHQATLARVGCRTLGDVRRLPRGGLGRRFDQQLLLALDQAYGLRPEAHRWVALPEHFNVRMELPARVDHAEGLMFPARRLLVQMCGWLAARNSGAAGIAFSWQHDALRSNAAGASGATSVRTAEATRDAAHFARLLSEHLAKVKLAAPVIEVSLQAIDVTPLEVPSVSLIPDPVRAGEKLGLVLERIAARLGPHRVKRPVLHEDHRLEAMQTWEPATDLRRRRGAAVRPADIPLPTWLLAKPLKLHVQDHYPVYQGKLKLLAGPHRVEGGWWDRSEGGQGVESTRQVQRDFWVAASENAGLLCIFQERLAHDAVSWYLLGVFA